MDIHPVAAHAAATPGGTLPPTATTRARPDRPPPPRPPPGRAPWLVFIMWLDAVTYLHHHGPHDPEEKMPWYR
jgi:hypothetical protein